MYTLCSSQRPTSAYATRFLSRDNFVAPQRNYLFVGFDYPDTLQSPGRARVESPYTCIKVEYNSMLDGPVGQIYNGLGQRMRSMTDVLEGEGHFRLPTLRS